jgi:ethanolamine utilization microcompartment shell protein EutS
MGDLREGAKPVPAWQSGHIRHPDKALCRAACELAKQELARALEVLTFEPDRTALIASANADVRPD